MAGAAARRRLWLAWVMALACAGPALADHGGATHLLSLHTGSARSDLARELGRGGYELGDGTPVRLRPWYSTRWPDTTALLLTELSPSFGVIWGVSTGERGEKVRIAPALHLGFIARHEPFPNAAISFSVTTVIGGALTEKTCVGDYGDQGVSTVNCRLAASPLPPAETLDYLARMPGRHETRLSLRFDYRF